MLMQFGPMQRLPHANLADTGVSDWKAIKLFLQGLEHVYVLHGKGSRSCDQWPLTAVMCYMNLSIRQIYSQIATDDYVSAYRDLECSETECLVCSLTKAVPVCDHVCAADHILQHFFVQFVNRKCHLCMESGRHRPHFSHFQSPHGICASSNVTSWKYDPSDRATLPPVLSRLHLLTSWLQPVCI